MCNLSAQQAEAGMAELKANMGCLEKSKSAWGTTGRLYRRKSRTTPVGVAPTLAPTLAKELLLTATGGRCGNAHLLKVQRVNDPGVPIPSGSISDTSPTPQAQGTLWNWGGKSQRAGESGHQLRSGSSRHDRYIAPMISIICCLNKMASG